MNGRPTGRLEQIKLRHIRVILFVGSMVMLTFAWAKPIALADDRADPPIQVRVTARHQGKAYSCTADLILVNNRDVPVWFVFAYHANKLLPYEGDFRSENGTTVGLFGASKYDERKGAAIILKYYGKDAFKAIRLPAKGRCHFSAFVLEAGQPLRFFDAWEVKSLKVDDKVLLEEWMPYNVTSTATTEIAGRLYSGKQEVLGLSGKPYPTKEVTSVKADVIKRHVIPLTEQ